jgi:haloacetate dehalogenase
MTVSRRELFKQAAAVAAGFAAATVPAAHAQQPAGETSRFISGFKTFKVQTSGATINGVIGGQGPPLLLLHGAPQCHITWRLVAPELAKTYTVVATDLRGYGDSSKPADVPDHATYSKRAMALDQVEVMKSFGYETFRLVGQDRGTLAARAPSTPVTSKTSRKCARLPAPPDAISGVVQTARAEAS